ncbi:hypothetical protein RCH09_002513 [Actimicrobium sp. GrIS 1.19]|uniref:hypothetical protein n=1 Tax=Actimicrobium sp. GrIS 1.19 TaxID=3071708 RepID=UPI002E0A7860|nr:hypothetical protein [Actimicrobium sp. GrIS 1.19]
MTTTRSKRWNGKIETLTPEFLNQVMIQMETYGDRVQFALSTPGAKPNYQVINSDDKRMAFDSNHHLLHPKADEFEGVNATGILSTDKIKAAIAGGGKAAPVKRSTRNTAATIKATDLVDAAKYAYFKTNRSMLPAAIGEHSDEITTLMRNGMSAEDAFGEVVKRHF